MVSDDQMKEIMQTAADMAGVSDIGELSDGFHTFNSLYRQRCVLFATLVNLFPDISWKSRKHEDGDFRPKFESSVDEPFPHTRKYPDCEVEELFDAGQEISYLFLTLCIYCPAISYIMVKQNHTTRGYHNGNKTRTLHPR